MGQAKLRGTKEQRVQEGIEKRKEEELLRDKEYKEFRKNNPSDSRSSQLLASMLGVVASGILRNYKKY